MSAIHYFPRYSQKENMVTNNTMLLLKRLYNNSTEKFNIFLNGVLQSSDVELDLVMKFGQQEQGAHSVPDAFIQQEAFKVIIETKLYGQQYVNQIENHLSEFDDLPNQVFLWIDRRPIDQDYRKKVVEVLNKKNMNRKHRIMFASTTFKEICSTFNDVLNDFDFEMKSIIQDFESFCFESSLIDNSDSKVRFVAAGTSYAQNRRYNIYYDNRDNSYQDHTFIGLYSNKRIKAIGKISNIVDVDYDIKTKSIKLIEDKKGKLIADQIETIKNVIEEAFIEYGYSLENNHRFFYVDEYVDTNFIKISKNGMMGKRYYDLTSLPEYKSEMTAKEIALMLIDQEWS